MDGEAISFPLEILDAKLAAIGRAQEITAMMLAAEDQQAAIRSVARLLGTSEAASRAVLDTPWRHLTRAAQHRLSAEADRLRRGPGPPDPPS